MIFVEESSGEEDKDEAEDEDDQEEEEELPELTTAELFMHRQTNLAEMKNRIALMASSIIEDPEHNVSFCCFFRLCFILHQ